jgi:membrane-associated protease RseP (regulator of RpoE activity)
MLAGWLLRRHQSIRAATLPYLEIGIPAGVIVYNFLMNQLLIALGWVFTFVPIWMSTLMYLPLAAATLAAIKQIHWPWRVVLHMIWLGALAAVIVYSVSESQRPGPVLGVSTVKNSWDYKILPDSPADRAGLQTGDLIVGIDEQKIAGFAELQQVIRSKRIGDTIVVTIQREGIESRREVALTPLSK